MTTETKYDYVGLAEGLAHLDFDTISHTLRMCLVGSDGCQNFGKGLRLLEPSGIYRLYFVQLQDPNDSHLIPMPITAEMVKRWDVDITDIHKATMKNVAAEAIIQPTIAPGNFPGLFVVSNQLGFLGSGAIMADNVQAMLDRGCPDGWIILPSSVHEVLVAPRKYNKDTLLSLREMIRGRNHDPQRPVYRPVLSDDLLMYKDGHVYVADI